MADEPLMNSDTARTPTGEIVDQAAPPADTAKPEANAAAASTETPDGSTALTKPEVKPDAAVVPDKYEFKAPEGYTLSPELLDAVTPIFKEAGLAQDVAQKLVDFHAKQMLDAAKGPQDAYAATRADWQSKTQSDPDMKTYGFDKVKTDIGRALNALGDPTLVSDFKQAMDITGAGDHPAFVKAMWKLSQHIAEGRHVSGAGPSPEGQRGPNDKPKSVANALYPNLP